jgi:hypothetical protein
VIKRAAELGAKGLRADAGLIIEIAAVHRSDIACGCSAWQRQQFTDLNGTRTLSNVMVAR